MSVQAARPEEGTAAERAPHDALYSNAYALVANQVSSAVLGFLYWMLAARLYPVEVVGTSSAAISTILLIAALAQFGLKGGMARFIPRAGARVRVLIFSGYALVAATAGVTAAAALWVTGRLGLRAMLALGAYAPLLVVGATVAWALFYLQDGVLIGLRKSVWVLGENLTFNLAKIALLVAGARMLGSSGIVGSWFLPAPVAVVIVTAAVLVHLRVVPPADREDEPRLSVREVASSVTADHAGSIAAEASVRLLPVIVLGVMGAAANAYFYQAWLVANTLTLVASSMTSSFAAEAAAAPDRIAQHGRGILRHMSAIILPAAAVLVLAAPQVLSLFGSRYAESGAAVLRLLALAALPVTFNVWYVSYALVTARPRRAFAVQALGAALLVGLAYPLLHAFGTPGVALAWLGAQSLLAVVCAPDAVPALLRAGRPAETPTPASLLRRADFRFLLDTPVLGRTALFASGVLADAVRPLAREIAEAGCDVAVVGGASPAILRDAYGALREGGACYAESDGGAPFEALRLSARMRRAGFTEVRVFWPLPSAERARVWPAVRARTRGYAGALRATMAGVLPRPLAHAVATAASTGATLGRVCAIGRKPGQDPGRPWLADRVAGAIGAASGRETLLVMRTGGERAENRVNWLAFEPGAGRPWAIAKASRTDAGVQRRERAMLDLLARRAPAAIRVPAVVLDAEEDGVRVLVETMLAGEPALESGRADGYDTFARRVTDALLSLAGAPLPTPAAEWVPRLVEPLLADLDELLAGSPQRGLVARARVAVRGSGTLPLVLAHDDCSPWNLVVAGDTPGLYDWECGHDAGLPLTDLVYCLATTALWLDGDPDPRAIAAAYDRLLDPADALGAVFAREIGRYASALGLSDADVATVRLATWLLHARNDVRNLVRAHAPLERSVCLPLLRAELTRHAEWPPEGEPPAERDEAVFVSPHLDDAVLSCGAGIARLVARGSSVVVATVFTADAPAGVPLSPQARRNHMRWGSSSPFAIRRAEDEEALRLLGAGCVHLGLPDAIYRRDAAGRPVSTHTPLDDHDAATVLPVLRERLGLLLAAHPLGPVFCPTAFGRQADHALVRAALQDVCPPERLVYYDEYPYITRTDPAPPPSLPAGAFTLAPSAEELAARASAIGCYASQLRGLFPTRTQRLAEVVAARIPALAPWLLPPPRRGRDDPRLSERVAKDAGALGGERYRLGVAVVSPFEADARRRYA